jgi:hypothetical protein
MIYYLEGHAYVIAIVVLIVLYTIPAMHAGCNLNCVLLELHLLALGFAWMHVAIHAPMMIPVILGVRHAKRYTQAPYVFALLSAVLWPFMGIVSLILIILSLAGMIYVFLKI